MKRTSKQVSMSERIEIGEQVVEEREGYPGHYKAYRKSFGPGAFYVLGGRQACIEAAQEKENQTAKSRKNKSEEVKPSETLLGKLQQAKNSKTKIIAGVKLSDIKGK